MDALEEKCYAIRGRRGVQAKMNFSQKAPKLPIETPENNKATSLMVVFLRSMASLLKNKEVKIYG